MIEHDSVRGIRGVQKRVVCCVFFVCVCSYPVYEIILLKRWEGVNRNIEISYPLIFPPDLVSC